MRLQTLSASRTLSKENRGLLSLLYTLKLASAFVIRAVLASGLALALLAGLLPGSLSSAQQTCTMSCCTGKPTHLAGSCSAAFSDDHHAETNDESVTDHRSHTGAAHADNAAPEIIEATSHCGTTKDSSEKRPPEQRSSPQATSIIAHALTTPGSPECAAAVSTFSQVRRPRSVAALPANIRPRAPTLRNLAEQVSSLQTSPEVFCRQSRPRAPPLVFNHLPA